MSSRNDERYLSSTGVSFSNEAKNHSVQAPDDGSETVYFDKDGCASTDEEQGAVAKAVVSNRGQQFFYILVGKDVYNPVGTFTRSDDIGRVVNGVPVFSFREVSKDIFSDYIDFLETKSDHIHRSVSRRFFNG